MEFYALLSVAKEFNLNIAGIFVITNYTNKTAHEDFMKKSLKGYGDLNTIFTQTENYKIVSRETLKENGAINLRLSFRWIKRTT